VRGGWEPGLYLDRGESDKDAPECVAPALRAASSYHFHEPAPVRR